MEKLKAVTSDEERIFQKLLQDARMALKILYTPIEADEIIRAFDADPAELIAIAGRDLVNRMRESK